MQARNTIWRICSGSDITLFKRPITLYQQFNFVFSFLQCVLFYLPDVTNIRHAYRNLSYCKYGWVFPKQICIGNFDNSLSKFLAIYKTQTFLDMQTSIILSIQAWEHWSTATRTCKFLAIYKTQTFLDMQTSIILSIQAWEHWSTATRTWVVCNHKRLKACHFQSEVLTIVGRFSSPFHVQFA